MNSVEAVVRDVLYLGSMRKFELVLPNGNAAVVREQLIGGVQERQPGDQVRLTWAVDDGVLVADPNG